MFKASEPPEGDLESLRLFIAEEFQRLALDLETGQMEYLQLVERFVVPVKPREGIVVFADGTSWNPGAGRGVYVYSAGLWVKL